VVMLATIRYRTFCLLVCWLVNVKITICKTTISSEKLSLTSLKSGGLLLGIVRSRTKATEFCYNFVYGSVWV
jgi:hypothetical protein